MAATREEVEQLRMLATDALQARDDARRRVDQDPVVVNARAAAIAAEDLHQQLRAAALERERVDELEAEAGRRLVELERPAARLLSADVADLAKLQATLVAMRLATHSSWLGGALADARSILSGAWWGENDST